MEHQAVRTTIEGPVATVWLNRPHRHNAWTGKMHTELKAAMARIEMDPTMRAVVIAGTGSAFCVGGDAEALSGHAARGGYDDGVAAADTEPGMYRNDGYDADLVWLMGYRLPVIAAVNGACAGIGLALAACCDLRFGCATAKLTTAAPTLGLPAEYGLTWLLPRIIGLTRAADLLLSGRRVTVADTAEWGLWNEVLPNGEATVAAAQRYAAMLAETCGPTAVSVTKQQLYRDVRHNDPARSVTDSVARLDAAMRSAEYREGITALVDRRPPRFANPDL